MEVRAKKRLVDRWEGKMQTSILVLKSPRCQKKNFNTRIKLSSALNPSYFTIWLYLNCSISYNLAHNRFSIRIREQRNQETQLRVKQDYHPIFHFIIGLSV